MDPRYVFYIIGAIVAFVFSMIVILAKIEERRLERENKQK